MAEQRSGVGRVVAIVAVVVVLAAAGVFGLVALVMGAMRSSEPCRMALERVRADERVAAKLGGPVEEAFLLSGSVQTTNDSGEARLHVPISGPGGSGVVQLAATREQGVWTLRHLVVQIDATGDFVPLVVAPPAPHSRD